jgi:hypothetical protein
MKTTRPTEEQIVKIVRPTEMTDPPDGGLPPPLLHESSWFFALTDPTPL